MMSEHGNMPQMLQNDFVKKMLVILVTSFIALLLSLLNAFHFMENILNPTYWLSEIMYELIGNFYLIELTGFDYMFIVSFPIWLSIFYYKLVMQSWLNLTWNFLISYMCLSLFFMVGVLIAPLLFVRAPQKSELLPDIVFKAPIDFYWTIIIIIGLGVSLKLNLILAERLSKRKIKKSEIDVIGR